MRRSAVVKLLVVALAVAALLAASRGRRRRGSMLLSSYETKCSSGKYWDPKQNGGKGKCMLAKNCKPPRRFADGKCEVGAGAPNRDDDTASWTGSGLPTGCYSKSDKLQVGSDFFVKGGLNAAEAQCTKLYNKECSDRGGCFATLGAGRRYVNNDGGKQYVCWKGGVKTSTHTVNFNSENDGHVAADWGCNQWEPQCALSDGKRVCSAQISTESQPPPMASAAGSAPYRPPIGYRGSA